MEAAEVAAVVGMVAEYLDAEDYDDEHEGITEESVAELMSVFELEIKRAAGANALPLPLPPSTTVSERKESCGPSLSRPASTVMAPVDGRAGVPPPLAAEPWPWTRPVPKPAAGEEEDVDEWVSQLLTDGPPVEGQQQEGGQ